MSHKENIGEFFLGSNSGYELHTQLSFCCTLETNFAHVQTWDNNVGWKLP